jgi:hypothetical protein
LSIITEPYLAGCVEIGCVTGRENIIVVLRILAACDPSLYSLYPSSSALFMARNSLSHLSGFSGSVVARCFIASSKCGVTYWFKYTLVGLPWGTGCVGACCAGALGCGLLREETGGGGCATGAGVGVAVCTVG